jgi:hydrogenase maturation protease
MTRSECVLPLLFIAFGHPFRSDDGLGVVVGHALNERLQQVGSIVPGSVCFCCGDLTDVLALWAGRDAVVIDAVEDSRAAPGSLLVREVVSGGRILPAWSDWSQGGFTSTHGLDLSQALQLAQVLGQLPNRLRVAGAVGQSFAHGIGLTEPLRAAVADLLAICLEWASAAQSADNHGEASHLEKENTDA